MSKRFNIKNMKGGWFVGDFEPSIFRSKDFEVGMKFVPAGTESDDHYHKVTQELTVFVSGLGIYNGEEYGPGDILLLEPYDKNSILFKEDSHIICLKTPSAPEDKYY